MMQHLKQTGGGRLKWLVVTCALIGAYLSILGSTTSHAQLYKWVDENGKTHYTDTIPPASTDRARTELRSDGTVKQSTDRAATAEEKRLAAAKAAEDAKLRVAQDERERKDKALLNTYSSLEDFDRVRDRALGTIASDIRALQEREILLNKVIASDGKFVPPVVAPVPASVPTPAAPPVKPAPVKTAGTLLLEAQSDLPRVKEAFVGKRRDLEDLTAHYATDRLRLAKLVDAENAKMNPANSTVADRKSVSTPAQPATKKK
jgi:hypothetical protein